ncbi:MAG: DUF1273 family protein [Clostridia bacterium]|nr:DUF1273 family protein [Clostridia bacterium]
MQTKTCCFSGHRPKAFPWKYDESAPQCVWLKGRIANEIEKAVADGFTRFIAGGAAGVDMWCAEAVIDFKRTHNRDDISLVLAIPFLNYAVYFSEKEKARLVKIIEASDERILTSSEEDKSHAVRKYYKRNEYMVDNSQRLIAVFEPDLSTKGGTKYTVEYAKKVGVEVVTIRWDREYAKKASENRDMQ